VDTHVIIYLFFYQLPHTPIEVIKIIATGFRGFWFLPILYILYLFTPSLRTYVHNEKIVKILLPLTIWFLLVTFLPLIRNTAAFPLQSRNDILSQVIDFSGYFLLGYFITTSNYFKTKKVSLALIGTGLLWSIIGTLYLYSKDTSVYAYISPSTVILSVGIFSLFLNLDKTFNALSARAKKLVAEISNLIFGVYLLLTLAVQVFTRINFTIPHTSLPTIIDLPLVAFIFFICILSIVFLLSRIPYLKKIIT
jgi:surface polysaccharide O-acyltransferase-like enzyme